MGLFSLSVVLVFVLFFSGELARHECNFVDRAILHPSVSANFWVGIGDIFCLS